MKQTKCDISNGQWKSIKKKNGYYRVVAGDDNYPIANLYQNDANANLIASAPEMLNALKMILDYHDRDKDNETDLHFENARDVIANAGGE
jgi:hypothetical protein